MVSKSKDITGKSFGKLVAVNCTDERYRRHVIWSCKCDCGKQIKIPRTSLVSGNTHSCGCADFKENTKISSLDQKTRTDNKSGYKGVHWDKERNMWKSTLKLKGELLLNARFVNLQDAISARKEAEEKYFKPILEKYEKEKNHEGNSNRKRKGRPGCNEDGRKR